MAAYDYGDGAACKGRWQSNIDQVQPFKRRRRPRIAYRKSLPIEIHRSGFRFHAKTRKVQRKVIANVNRGRRSDAGALYREDSGNRRLTDLITEVIISLESDAMAQSKKRGMPLDVYKQLWELHAGLEQIRRALASLAQQPTFQAREVERLGTWLEEARAATASYLTGAIEDAETNEAGRLFKNRLARERKEQ